MAAYNTRCRLLFPSPNDTFQAASDQDEILPLYSREEGGEHI
jgi:hypothetical protein